MEHGSSLFSELSETCLQNPEDRSSWQSLVELHVEPDDPQLAHFLSCASALRVNEMSRGAKPHQWPPVANEEVTLTAGMLARWYVELDLAGHPITEDLNKFKLLEATQAEANSLMELQMQASQVFFPTPRSEAVLSEAIEKMLQEPVPDLRKEKLESWRAVVGLENDCVAHLASYLLEWHDFDILKRHVLFVSEHTSLYSWGRLEAVRSAWAKNQFTLPILIVGELAPCKLLLPFDGRVACSEEGEPLQGKAALCGFLTYIARENNGLVSRSKKISL